MNNLELMRKRLQFHGGVKQEDRMIKDKWRTLQKALIYSYQGCDVSLAQKYNSCEILKDQENYRALINPNKTKQDYDDKILSIDYNTHFGPGDVINWEGTNTQWLIYLQSLTEDAYFKGDIRKCNYLIKFKDDDGEIYQTYAAVRGPVETAINTFQKNQISLDKPNFSLNILMPLNDLTGEAFNRYSKFILNGKAWEVQAVDSISMLNILQISAQEDYVNLDKDDLEEGIINGLVIEPIDPNPESEETKIEGLTFIKPKITEIYKAPDKGGKWSIKEKDFPVCIKVTNDPFVSVTWEKTTSGQFTLQWSKDDIIFEKIIIVESLF